MGGQYSQEWSGTRITTHSRPVPFDGACSIDLDLKFMKICLFEQGRVKIDVILCNSQLMKLDIL